MVRLISKLQIGGKSGRQKWPSPEIFSKFFGLDNLERAVASGEGVIVDRYVKAVLLQQAAGTGQEEGEIEHDKRRALERVAEVHGGVEAAGEQVAGRPNRWHLGRDEDEAAAGLQRRRN